MSYEFEPEKAWKGKDVGYVYECSGQFLDRDKAQLHLDAGAKRVILSGPSPSADFKAVFGVNHDKFDPDNHLVVSNTSCTTNCLAPGVKVLRDFDFQGGGMATVHAYTADQNLQDAPHKDLRRARAAAENMIPTSTGGAKMIGEIFPDLKGKIDGMALRVPTVDVSGVFLTCLLGKKPSVDDLKKAFTDASKSEQLGRASVSYTHLTLPTICSV